MYVMRMTPMETFRELENVSERLSRLLAASRSGAGDGQKESMALADWAPAVDVLETDTEFQIQAELPGLEKEQVSLSVEEGVLTISGRREQEKEGNGKRYHKIERAYGGFARSFTVPDLVDQHKVSAEFKNGVLTVRLPKSEKARAKAIEVKVT
ncbi:Hsp20/alpha crystallin family protein [Nitrospira moscoviensis]|uniref:Heat shock protein, Hsp20 family n=1 Tax=Nitrospira moscoviensis TaxID=42253 RepID=A0A0K2GCK4_NITMO|nr:Hsp20/alpha crystallin family protein [Nitrospira moscoviensis]ALA58589.1 Heat shock protein, Hsp20 family [Nitrospira moscoviensis]